ncbi:hypothetical protein [Empedobacter brevis]|uniref:hypothetical protein n=1 Tax=Empedobacter brevis TaxID=247 RepID=UPI0028AAF9D6|nr:hypothetical protein [Empedobacter brevis]
MSFINRLFDASNSSENLADFIQISSIEIYDFFISQKNSSILSYRNEITNYILLPETYRVYSNLDFSDSKNQTFLYCLLDLSQRFGLSTEFQQLYNLATRNDVSINSRFQATNRFLVGIKTINDYEGKINDILNDLSVSYLEEEDNEQKTIATLINFYTEVFYNFGQQNTERVIEFKNKLLEELQKEEYSFLYTQSIDEVLSYSLDDINELYQAVHTKLDEVLERASQYLAFNIEPNLIESETHYAELLASISADFIEIRDLSAKLYSTVKNDSIFYSLNRGVNVLVEQNQLLAYLYSFGKMHYEKIISAINPIERHDLEDKFEVYDWGCGQGLASICFLQRLNEQDIDYFVSKFTLIEPSEIAIKRGSLHLRKFKSDIQIVTINKDLDSLENSDFGRIDNGTKIHLFSNILDIELFLMNDLINLIKHNFKGKNIFICVSPNESKYKRDRIDDFVQSFTNSSNFEIISNISEKNGEWTGTSWSRIIRVFKCIIK